MDPFPWCVQAFLDPAPQPGTETVSLSDLPFDQWLTHISPELTWHWRHLRYVRQHLDDVTNHRIDRLAISWPPQHAKTVSTTVHYTLWRMLHEPGLRAGIGCYNQLYANKVSRMIRRLTQRAGVPMVYAKRQDEWELANGSTFLARGIGGGIAGNPLDLMVVDDPFKNRKEADSVTVQERVYEWYMDDVTPRIQKGGAIIVIQTRWNAGDLIGRIRRSEEASEWRYVTLKAIADDNDPLDPKRQPGEALCEDRFPLAKLEQKRRTEGVGFESLYQQNEIPRGGTFFERAWFENHVVSHVPDVPGKVRRLRYWDLGGAKKRESTAWTAGVLLARDADYFYVEDVIRGRWAPAERNAIIRNTASLDANRPGFRKTYFEQQPGVAGEETTENLIRAMIGLPAEGDRVTGDKLVRAGPFADAARVGLVKLVAGPWNAAYLSELEAVPNGPWMDQCDSSSGAFNCHAKLPWGSPGSETYPGQQREFYKPPDMRDYAAEANLFGMGGR